MYIIVKVGEEEGEIESLESVESKSLWSPPPPRLSLLVSRLVWYVGIEVVLSRRASKPTDQTCIHTFEPGAGGISTIHNPPSTYRVFGVIGVQGV